MFCIYSGNFEGEKAYQSGGDACTGCPSDRPYCVNNLCSCKKDKPYNLIFHIQILVFLMYLDESGAGATVISLLAVMLMTLTSALMY